MRVILLILIGLSLLSAELTRDETTGIVNDNATGLEWQDNNISSLTTWENAIESCENLTLGGKSDWRLPNINELKSIVDRSKVDPAIRDGFEKTSSNFYWSSTTSKENKNEAWIVNFGYGYVSLTFKPAVLATLYVRCVRGGE